MSASRSIQLTQKRNRSNFTLEEDKYLVSLVTRHGEGDWIFIAKLMRSRNSRQCRERWNNYLNPRLNRKDWTAEDDRILLQLHQQNGSKWKYFTLFFDGRTDTMLKNRFNQLKRRECKIISNNESPIIEPSNDVLKAANNKSAKTTSTETISNISNQSDFYQDSCEISSEYSLPNSSEGENILDYLDQSLNISNENDNNLIAKKNVNICEYHHEVNNNINENVVEKEKVINIPTENELEDFLEMNESCFFQINAFDSENGEVDEFNHCSEFFEFE